MANKIEFKDLPQEIQSFIKNEYESFQESIVGSSYYFIDGKYYDEYKGPYDYGTFKWVDSHFEEIDWDEWETQIKK